MALYKIEWKHSARKELKRLERKVITRIVESVEALSKILTLEQVDLAGYSKTGTILLPRFVLGSGDFFHWGLWLAVEG